MMETHTIIKSARTGWRFARQPVLHNPYGVTVW
jgi:hypothetical protein